MKTIEMGTSGLKSSRLVYGCMRICGDSSKEPLIQGERALEAAVETGYTQFDHADIYAGGESEKLFGQFLKKHHGLRDKLIITGKCGIRRKGEPSPNSPGRYDFSRDYLTQSVESSLKRLQIGSLDFLLMHRPDYLMDAAEVAETFEILKESGKVKNFGVSNFTPSQFELLQSSCSMPLHINQVEINLYNYSAFEDGTLDICQRLKVTPQAWCPLGGVAYEAWGNTLKKEEAVRLQKEVDLQANKYGVDRSSIPLLFLLKHPAGICPIIGSSKPQRIQLATKALEVDYQREDWYRLLEARRGHPVA